MKKNLKKNTYIVIKNLPANAGDAALIPGSESPPGGGSGNLLQYFCLENPMDREAWQATVHGVEKESYTTSWLNNNNMCVYTESLCCTPETMWINYTSIKKGRTESTTWTPMLRIRTFWNNSIRNIEQEYTNERYLRPLFTLKIAKCYWNQRFKEKETY